MGIHKRGPHRGATGLQYAVVIGLIGVAAMAAVQGFGDRLGGQFRGIALTMNQLAPAFVTPAEPAPEPPGNSAGLAFTPASATAMNVTGPGQPGYGSVVSFTLTNPGDHPAAPLSVSIASGAGNFEIQSTSCGPSLAGGQSCSIAVRPRATRNGALAGTLLATAESLSAEASLAGTASDFSIAPQVQSFSHSTRRDSATASWSGGFSDGSCNVALGNGNVVAANVSCNDHSGTFTFSGLMASGNWNGMALNLVDAGDGTVLASLGTLTCTRDGPSAESDNEDNDCDGTWDEIDASYTYVIDTFTLGPCTASDAYLRTADREIYCAEVSPGYYYVSHVLSSTTGSQCTRSGNTWASIANVTGSKIDKLTCGYGDRN